VGGGRSRQVEHRAGVGPLLEPGKTRDEHRHDAEHLPDAEDNEGLLAVLDPDVVVRTDAAAGPPGAPKEIRGARTSAKGALAFSQAARFAQPALVNGAVGLVLAPRGRLFRALMFTITRGKIAEVDVVADPARLRQLDLAVLKRLTSQPGLRAAE
jgi:hypothetical protein